MLPQRPVRRGGPAPPVRGSYKQTPEDFAVEEIPLYEPSGEGTHTYVWIEKRGCTTWDAAERLARACERKSREVGYAGLKDAHAVTRQWLSLEHVDPERVRSLELEDVRVLEVSRHKNKLKLGHLRGNRFEIVVREIEEGAREKVAQNLAAMAATGVPNWFGPQRFGKAGQNLDKGLRILAGNPRKAARRVPKPVLRMIISAVQSEVFNRVLSERIDSLDQIRDGDVAWLHVNGAAFLVDDALAEQHRCDNFEISPSGPMPGPKMLRAAGEQAELEQRVLDELSLTYDVFGTVPYGTNEGVRRPLRVPLRGPAVEEVDGGLELGFELPKGSFATAVLGELLAELPWVEVTPSASPDTPCP